jgi:prohibitin 2
MKIKTNEIQIALGVLGLGGLLFTLNYSVYKVEPGFQAIKFSKITGVGSKVYKEGLHLLLPWFERPLIYDCRMKNIIFNCDCGTSGNLFVLI